jgi:L-threonylcarbamoyladenylate synthase
MLDGSWHAADKPRAPFVWHEEPGLSSIFDMRDSALRHAGIDAAAAALAAGELVGMPTETVYGLAADASNPNAVAAIFLAKGRPRFNPLIVHVGSLAKAEALAFFSADALRLAETFWPGPLTVVVRQSTDAPIADLVTAGLDTIALRAPSHPVARELLAAFGGPIAAPSANLSGHVSATTTGHVAADLGDKVACILDAGPTDLGLESTIVDVSRAVPLLLRPGAVTRERIEAVLGRALALAAHDESRPRAPGMLTSHYAPLAKLRLNATEVFPGEALLAFGERLPPGARDAVAVQNLSPSGDLTEAGRNFFSALRALDGKAATLAVMPIPDSGLGEAINDRLSRAAAPR